MDFEFVQADRPDAKELAMVEQMLEQTDYLTKAYVGNDNGVYHTVGLSRKMGVELFLNIITKNKENGVQLLGQLMSTILHIHEFDGSKIKEGRIPNAFGMQTSEESEEFTDMDVYLLEMDKRIIPVVAPILTMTSMIVNEYRSYQIILPDHNGQFPWESGTMNLGPDESYVQQYIIRPPKQHLN